MKRMLDARTLALLPILGACSMFLSTVEYLFPKPLPFMRLGLANLVSGAGLGQMKPDTVVLPLLASHPPAGSSAQPAASNLPAAPDEYTGCLRDVLGYRPVSTAALRDAVGAILGGRSRRVDAGRVSCTGLDGSPLTRCSVNTVMAGFGVDVNAKAERRRWLGALRYNVTILTQIPFVCLRPRNPCTLTIDGEARELDLFLAAIMCNKFTGTRHRIAPAARLDDGELDAIFTTQSLRTARKVAQLDKQMQAGGTHVLDPVIASVRAAQSVLLDGPRPQLLMVDGDIVGTTPLRIDVLPAAYALFTPESPPPT